MVLVHILITFRFAPIENTAFTIFFDFRFIKREKKHCSFGNDPLKFSLFFITTLFTSNDVSIKSYHIFEVYSEKKFFFVFYILFDESEKNRKHMPLNPFVSFFQNR